MFHNRLNDNTPQIIIEDISPLGEELSDKDLQLVAGGMMKADPDRTLKWIAFEGWSADFI